MSYYSLFDHYPGLSDLTLYLQASSFGIEFGLLRISVGLEDTHVLRAQVQRALDAVATTSQK